MKIKAQDTANERRPDIVNKFLIRSFHYHLQHQMSEYKEKSTSTKPKLCEVQAFAKEYCSSIKFEAPEQREIGEYYIVKQILPNERIQGNKLKPEQIRGRTNLIRVKRQYSLARLKAAMADPVIRQLFEAYLVDPENVKWLEARCGESVLPKLSSGIRNFIQLLKELY